MRLAHAVRVLGVLILGAGGTGCSLVLDFSDPPEPPDASAPDAISQGACDFGEDNDSRSNAFPLTPPVTSQSAAICEEGDRDFYAITVADNQTLTFQILFGQDGSHGDLDMRLLDEADQIVARSLSTDADEGIVCPGGSPSCPQLTAGNYFVEVFGFANSQINGYTINFTVE